MYKFVVTNCTNSKIYEAAGYKLIAITFDCFMARYNVISWNNVKEKIEGVKLYLGEKGEKNKNMKQVCLYP